MGDQIPVQHARREFQARCFRTISGSNYETVTGTYTAPNDANAWFIQGILDFVDSTDYDVSYFSIKRTKTSDTTDDFRMSLSGKSYDAAGKLGRFETKDFSINPVDLADRDGVIKFTASIKGNHYGMARLIYHAPLLMGRNARYKVNSVKGNTYDITLTAKLSGLFQTRSICFRSAPSTAGLKSGRTTAPAKIIRARIKTSGSPATAPQPGKES